MKALFLFREGGDWYMAKFTRETCIDILCKKHKFLREHGDTRYPQRSDFANDEVSAIKAFLGPWPRALEAAGIKPPRQDDRIKLNREKRIRSKRRRNEMKKAQKRETKDTSNTETNADMDIACKNNEEKLTQILSSITFLNSDTMDAARKRQAQLAKPPGSLGTLEELSIQLAGITGRIHNAIDKRLLLVFAADNGVVEEGVACTPQSVTLAQTINLVRGKTGAAVLAHHFGCELWVCDVGVNADIHEPAVIHKKISYGTQNIAKVPAMTRKQAVEAMVIGAELAIRAANEGYNIVGVGEMGIGNTTTSAAVLAVFSGEPVRMVTGRGGGMTDEGYLHKIQVIERAIAVNAPNPEDPLDVVSKVGGLDIAAMAGAFLGAASAKIPAVMDGFISVTAALLAVKLCPTVREYLIPSHASYEIGYRVAMRELGLSPMLNLGMRLGEGSGCPIAFQVIDAACAVMNDMATFDEAGIDDSYLEEIRKKDSFTVKEDGAE